MDDWVEALTAPWVRTLRPYKVEPAAGLTKLDAMENPYGFPDELRDQWANLLTTAAINRYPDPHATALKAAIRRSSGIDDSLAVVVGNGSDELIHLLCLAFGGPGASVLAPAPSFAVYRLAAQALGLSFQEVALRKDDFALDVEAMLEAVQRYRPALTFIASPNNPTGNRFRLDDIRTLCEASPGLVVLDEAYWRFAGRSEVSALAQHRNLMVMQTLSKIGLAGLRLGMLYCAAAVAEPLERVRMPFNVGTLAQLTAELALNNEPLFNAQIERICRERERVLAGLEAIAGVTPRPSETNFILCRIDAGADRTFAALHRRGMLVKNLHGSHSMVDECLRLTIGLPEENDRLLRVLAELH